MEKCMPFEPEIKDVTLAQAYVPIQRICTLMEPAQALLAGTVFPELIK